MKKKDWSKVNKYEKDWWGDCCNTYNEEIKQFYYATIMGLDIYKIHHKFDLKG